MTMQDKSSTKQLNTRIPIELHDALRAAAYFSRQSINEIVIEALKQYLLSNDEVFRAVLSRAIEDNASVLDKLKDL
jgi:uncharacterized protein (DUF1778 family)